MRKLSLLLLFVTLPAFAARFENIVIPNGEHTFMQEMRFEGNQPTIRRDVVSFERNGVSYEIRDTATIARLQKLVEPMITIGNEQARIGEQQAAIGEKQAAIGQKQAAVATQQISARGARAEALAERQEELAARQHELAQEQEPLARKQNVLARRQQEAQRTAMPKVESLFEEAIRTGSAKRR